MVETDRSGATQRLAELEETLYEAMVAQDFARLDQLLADDVLYIHSTGVAESKTEYFAGVKAGLYDYEAIRSRDVAIRVYGHSAVMTGIVEMSVSERPRPKAWIRLLFTLIWVRRQEVWRLVLRQATRVP